MEHLPREISVIIISYLDELYQVQKLIYLYNWNLTNTDYITLFRVNTNYYKPELNKYNTKRVYYGFLIAKEISTRRRRESRERVGVKYSDPIGGIYSYLLIALNQIDKEYVYEFCKYLYLENIKDIRISTDILSQIDDIEITKKIIEDNTDKGNTFIGFIYESAVKSVKYIIQNRSGLIRSNSNRVINYDIISETILEAYGNGDISPEMNQVILDTSNFTEIDLINILCSILNLNYKYIPDFIKRLPDKLSLDAINHIISYMKNRQILHYKVMRAFIEQYNILDIIEFDIFYKYYQTVLQEAINYGSSGLKLIVYLSKLNYISDYVNNPED
jgi:hypothetical protein